MTAIGHISPVTYLSTSYESYWAYRSSNIPVLKPWTYWAYRSNNIPLHTLQFSNLVIIILSWCCDNHKIIELQCIFLIGPIHRGNELTSILNLHELEVKIGIAKNEPYSRLTRWIINQYWTSTISHWWTYRGWGLSNYGHVQNSVMKILQTNKHKLLHYKVTTHQFQRIIMRIFFLSIFILAISIRGALSQNLRE